ncbi:MAG: hypothetical protein NTY08_02860 [Proteobacteria bacterium]|jgi:F-type H+-transporting ATPase subunit b|nr:hypothetical protein [Pseudomonadota bacterium]
MEDHFDVLMGVILPYANFAIFLGLAIYFFRKPAAAAAKKRREQYSKLVAEATAARDAAVSKLNELKNREESLADELASIKADSRESAEQEASKIVADAERLATHLRAEAGRIAAAEVAKARAELRKEIVDTVTASVKEKLVRELSVDTQLVLARKKIDELKHVGADS